MYLTRQKKESIHTPFLNLWCRVSHPRLASRRPFRPLSLLLFTGPFYNPTPNPMLLLARAALLGPLPLLLLLLSPYSGDGFCAGQRP